MGGRYPLMKRGEAHEYFRNTVPNDCICDFNSSNTQRQNEKVAHPARKSYFFRYPMAAILRLVVQARTLPRPSFIYTNRC